MMAARMTISIHGNYHRSICQAWHFRASDEHESVSPLNADAEQRGCAVGWISLGGQAGSGRSPVALFVRVEVKFFRVAAGIIRVTTAARTAAPPVRSETVAAAGEQGDGP